MIGRINKDVQPKASPNPSEGGEQTRKKAVRLYPHHSFPSFGGVRGGLITVQDKKAVINSNKYKLVNNKKLTR